MDTKKKTRPADPKRRSRPNTQGKTASRGRPQSEPRRREQAAPQRRREEPRRPREADNAQRRQQTAHQTAPQNAPEMVFKMDGKEKQKKHAPRDPVVTKRAQTRLRSAKRAKERKAQAARRSNAPKVVYTQPRPFNASRLLLQLAVMMAVVLAIVLGLSVFFKVEKVMVYGNKAYSAYAVQEAAGIEGGENLMSFGRIRASGKIKAALPYVDTVRIGINLPDTVNIYITEFDVVYSIESQNGTSWLMTSGGRIVEQTDGGTANNYTKVEGVKLDNPIVGEQAVAYEEINSETTAPDATTAEGETVTEPPVTVTANDQLRAALRILDALEANDLVGEAASIDVTNINDLMLWYGTRYRVRLGSINDPNHDLDYKINCMKQAIAQQSDYEMGILDVSFTTWQNQVGYTPFE